MSSETETTGWTGLIPYYPGDIAIATALTVGCWYAVSTVPTENWLRPALAVPFLLVFPGYAVLSALFPAAPQPASAGRTDRPRGIDIAERAGLTIAVSIPVLIALVIGLTVLGPGLQVGPATNALGLVTIGVLQVAALRRRRLEREQRFRVSPTAAFDRLVSTGSTRATLSGITLIVAVLLAAGVMLFAIVAPPAAGSYTELAIYGAQDDGEYAIGALPAAIEPNTAVDAGVEVSNQHDDSHQYVAIVQQQRLDGETVRDRTRLERIEYDLASGQTNRRDIAISPDTTVDQPVRIAVLLYDTTDGSVPDEATLENADQAGYFWLTVTTAPDEGTPVGE